MSTRLHLSIVNELAILCWCVGRAIPNLLMFTCIILFLRAASHTIKNDARQQRQTG